MNPENQSEEMELLEEINKLEEALILKQINNGIPVNFDTFKLKIMNDESSMKWSKSKLDECRSRGKPIKSSEKPKKNPSDDNKAKEKEADVDENKKEDIGRLDFRVGKILEVNYHPEADSLYIEKVDLGDGNIKTVCSGFVKFVPIETLKDRLVILLCNMKPVKFRGIMSEAMVMCAVTPDHEEVLIPPDGSKIGDIIEFEGFKRNPDQILNPKKKVFESLSPFLTTNNNKIACFKDIPFEIKGKGFVIANSLANSIIK